jgi:hypothetical protein
VKPIGDSRPAVVRVLDRLVGRGDQWYPHEVGLALAAIGSSVGWMVALIEGRSVDAAIIVAIFVVASVLLVLSRGKPPPRPGPQVGRHHADRDG